MISRQLTVGMRNRLRVHQQQKLVATVQARREVAHQRRHQVHQILFENFNRRRQVRNGNYKHKQTIAIKCNESIYLTFYYRLLLLTFFFQKTALAQQLELKNYVQLRAVKDENKVNLMRARRQHLVSVRTLASAAAISTLNSHTLPTQQELHAALANSSTHFTPFANGSGTTAPHPNANNNGRPITAPNPLDAYQPNSHQRNLMSSTHAGTGLPPIRGQTPNSLSASPPTGLMPPNPLQGFGGPNQLTLQMHVLRDLAEKVKLQFQTATSNQNRTGNPNAIPTGQ